MALGTGWVWVTGLALGVLINFLYAARHELSHATVFRTQVLNEGFGRAIGFIEIFPRDYDQIMHFAHHQYTQNWERDGELMGELMSKDESQYPMNKVWVVPASGGRTRRVAAE